MAQTLEHNSSVTTVTALSVPECEVETDVIQQLDDEPNDVGGLTASELKEKFDTVGEDLKDYINDDLIPAIIAADATEEAREEAEAERVANEIERVSNETSRGTAETARASAETTRGTNETTRQSQETTRQSNETSRTSAESARVTAETARDTAETNRATAESTRVSQETSRVNAESLRATAEVARSSAEDERTSAETTRIASENTRVNSETGRVSAESSRVSAENARNSYGTYSASTEYVRGNKVYYQGSCFVCLSTCTGQTPVEGSSYWQIIAKKGEDGTGAGDMLASDYDSDSTVKTAGGIKAYAIKNPSTKSDGQALIYNASTQAWEAGDMPTIDSAMSDSSENAVQNKVIKAYTDTKQSAITSTTATLASSGWLSTYSQTVNVSGVTASNNVIVSPSASSFADYCDAKIYCSAQGSGTLTFTCTDTPTTDITVNVLVM